MSTVAIPQLPPLDAAQRYSIPEAIVYLRSSRKTVYEDIRAGRLQVIKDGRRTYIHGSQLIRRSMLPRERAAA